MLSHIFLKHVTRNPGNNHHNIVGLSYINVYLQKLYIYIIKLLLIKYYYVINKDIKCFVCFRFDFLEIIEGKLYLRIQVFKFIVECTP